MEEQLLKNRAFISRVLDRCEAAAQPGDLLLWTAAGLCIFAISVVFNAFGLIHFEWVHYIAYHLEPGPVWKKIFDNRVLDLGVYAGRELSYLVDHADVRLVALSVQRGFPVFVSASHLGLAVFIGVWAGWFAAKDRGLGSLNGLLVALLFWTAPFVYLHYLNRSAKMLTAAALVVLIVEIHRAVTAAAGRAEARLSFRHTVSITLAAWVLSFADRQGFYFLVFACFLMGWQWALSRSRAARTISLLLFAVLALELVYFFWIAPALTAAFFGYAPDFSFNRLPVGELLADPVRFASQATALLGQTISLTLGRAPIWAVWLLLAALAAGADFRRLSWRGRVPLAGVIFAALAALWAMYALMILRHPPVLWPEMQLVYYLIPSGGLVVLGLVCTVGGWMGRHPRGKVVFAGGLLGLVGGNFAALPGHRVTWVNGHLKEYIESTPEIRYALTHRGDPRHVVPPEVGSLRAYQALLQHAPEFRRVVPRNDFPDDAIYRTTRDSGAPVRFVRSFGGNVDSRFVTTTADYHEAADGRRFHGATAGRMTMRVRIPSNRLRGEAILRRIGPEVTGLLAANFTIHVLPATGGPIGRWTQRVELPAGETEVTVPYAIDGSHRPALFAVDIPVENAGKAVAGWANPTITDTGGDFNVPMWFSHSASRVSVLEEDALARMLPGTWRPVRAYMRGGRVTHAGVQLSPGGEIWIKVNYIVSKFIGVATAAPGAGPGLPATTRGLWYKAGRLEIYAAPEQTNNPDGSAAFQAWCGEPGGWLVIMTDPEPDRLPVLIRITEVKQEN